MGVRHGKYQYLKYIEWKKNWGCYMESNILTEEKVVGEVWKGRRFSFELLHWSTLVA